MIKLIGYHTLSQLRTGNFSLIHCELTSVFQLDGLKIPVKLQALIKAWYLYVSLHQCTPGSSLLLIDHRVDP